MRLDRIFQQDWTRVKRDRREKSAEVRIDGERNPENETVYEQTVGPCRFSSIRILSHIQVTRSLE